MSQFAQINILVETKKQSEQVLKFLKSYKGKFSIPLLLEVKANE